MSANARAAALAGALLVASAATPVNAVQVTTAGGQNPASSGDARPIVALRNAPNPFRAGTQLFASFETGSLEEASLDAGSDSGATATFQVFDARGRLVRRLRGTTLGATAEAAWDGRDARGAALPAGVYFYRLDLAGHVSASGRAVLTR